MAEIEANGTIAAMAIQLLRYSAYAFAFLLAATAALAQYGTSAPGYFPNEYTGDTFKGVLTAVNGDQISVTFTSGSKTEVFTGRFENVCEYPNQDNNSGTARTLAPGSIPMGSGLTAYFMAKTSKQYEKKIKENWIIAISISSWGKREIPEKLQGLVSCGKNHTARFRAFQ